MAMPERDYTFFQIDRHIAETKRLIARQREFIAVLQMTKLPSAAAELMLEGLQKSLGALEHHRELVLGLYAATPPKRDPPNGATPPSRTKRLPDTIAAPSIAAE